MTKPLVFSYRKYEELREAYKELLQDNNRLIADNKRLRDRLRNLKVQLRIKEADRQKDDWIPCSERLPKIDEPVFVCWSDGRMTDGYRWDENKWFCAWEEYNGWDNTDRDDYIIAWMPLPKPYTKREEK